MDGVVDVVLLGVVDCLGVVCWFFCGVYFVWLYYL